MKPNDTHFITSTFSFSPSRRRTCAAGRCCRFAQALLLLTFPLARQVPAQTNSVPGASSILGRPERILIRPRPGQKLAPLHQAYGVHRLKAFPAIGGLEVIEVPPGISSDELVVAYRQSGSVSYAEKDHMVHAQLTPNDPYFANGACWQLRNTGVSGGAVGADIDASDAWNTATSAAGVIVAIVDSGVRYTHQDLAPNMWHNPNQNTDGYSGDLYGINAITGSGNPWDDFGHGTHVAGIIGAVGNNGAGVVGVCWSVQIMALKFIDSQGNGSVSDAVECINFAISHYAKIINFSWGDPSWNSQALYDAIKAAGNAGIIFTAACGNLGVNTDYNPYYPASYALGNLISVAATTRKDQLASYSSYGANSVSLGAPGDTILSCWNSSDATYQYLSGTSMAAPLVAGACALLWGKYPYESYSDIIHRIMWNVTALPALSGKCVSGGRLNLQAAMQATGPTPPSTVTATASDSVTTIGTSDTGAFTFTRDGDTSSDLTVNYQLGGTAVQWDDYRRPQGDMPTSIIIPAGSSSYTMIINAIGNETGANPETVTLTLSSNPSYNVGSPNGGTITIYPNTQPLPAVTVNASDPVATIGTSDTGAFTFTRTGDTSGSLTVNYQLGGTAVEWDDYRRPQGDMPTSIDIPAGSSSYTMIINAIGNETGANPETVVLTLSSAASYTVGSPNTGTMTIYPQTITLPTVSVTASDPVATIGTSDTGAFTFTRTGGSSTNLNVSYQLGGTALPLYDYRRPQGDMPLSVAIPAGSSSTTMIIDALANVGAANPETAILTLNSDPAYTVGSPSSGTVTIYPSVPLRIQSIQFSAPSNVTLTWGSISGSNYQVQYASTPAGGAWQNASGIITASGAITSWTGSVSGAGEQFYRVTRTS
jgi:subtilisin family serine protease